MRDSLGPTVQNLALHNPFFLAFVQSVVPLSSQIMVPGFKENFHKASILGWSSMKGLLSMRHPSFAENMKSHLSSLGASYVAAITEKMIDLKFEPKAFSERKDAIMFIICLRNDKNTVTENLKIDLIRRAKEIEKLGSRMNLLRYVLNIDITLPQHAHTLTGTIFAGGELESVAAVEQYWFSSTAEAAKFFGNESCISVLTTSSASINIDRGFLVTGQESVYLEKDLDF